MAAPVDHFVGITTAKLQTWLAEAQEDLASGVQLTSVSGGDASVSQRMLRSPENRIRLMWESLAKRNNDGESGLTAYTWPPPFQRTRQSVGKFRMRHPVL